MTLVFCGVVVGLPASLFALSITEIHYAPPAGDASLQFVEVFNDGSSVVDISGWSFAHGIDFVFPEGTVLAGRAYLVVCAHADAVKSRYGISNAVGDFSGSLSANGETLEIVNESGASEVQVSYRDRSKWPSSPKGTGHTLSLKSPYLDPDDGVSWTASQERGGTPGRANFPAATPGVEETELIAKGAVWRYKKGVADFSSPPAAWRAIGYGDGAWLSGPTGIGYGDNDDATVLDDMQNNYLSIACRKTFTLTAKEIETAEQLVLAIDYDDGFIAYLNGVEVTRAGLGNPGDATPFNATADNHEALVEEEFTVPKSLLVAGANVLAVEVHNTAPESTDLSFIPRLILRRTIPQGTASVSSIAFNEIFGRTGGERWLELFNRGDASIDLTGYGLTDDPSQLAKYVLPADSSIAARGFFVVTEAASGLDFASIEVALYLSEPTGGPVVEARIFENATATDRTGTSDARVPDGSGPWGFSRTPTRGAPNVIDVERDVVINEIMYHALETRNSASEAFESRPGEYIELYNRGTHTVALEGFRFTQGVQFTFPAGASLAPGEYAVVAQDLAYMNSVYGLGGVFGPWQGSLQNDGETIRLEDPLGNVVNEVRYFDGGDWSELADGQGSSLELADPRQDNSAGTAWEASDESHKAAWTQLSYTGTYEDLAGDEDLFRFTPMREGSFLLDDVEITRGATQLVSEPGFEGGTNGWLIEGTLVHSTRTTEEAHSGAACLKVIATDRGDLRVNRLAVIPRLPMTPGTYTVGFWVRWLRGGNLILAHGFDNDMARTLWFPVPRDLGTPGRENGATARLRAAVGAVNAGPVFKSAAQSPVRPRPGEAVSVSVSASDADGIASVKVFYRASRRDGPFTPIDLAPLSSAAPSGGRFGASLPGFADGTKVLYYFEATDSTGQTRRYPTAAPERTLLFQTGSPRGGSLIHYSLVLDDDRKDELESRSIQSDDPLFGSFVFDDREIYQNVGIHYHGSPWERPGTPRSFKLSFPGDLPLHGAKKFNISRYGSNLNESAAYYTIGRNGHANAPAPHGRYEFVRWDVNGEDLGIMGRVETVDGSYLKRWFPGDDAGPLFRTNGKITLRIDESWSLTNWAALEDHGANKELYRWTWDLHTREMEDDWSPLLALLRVMDSSTTPSDAQFETLVAKTFDVDEAVRVLSVRALNDDWDSVGFGNGQNCYFYYAPIEGRWKFIPWDMDGTFNNTGASFTPEADPGTSRLMSRPRFLRSYLQAQRRNLTTTWSEAGLRRLLDPNSGAGVGNEDGILGFVNARRPAALAFSDRVATFRILTHGGSDFVVSTEAVTLDGEAPLEARFLILAGGESALEPTWTSVTAWRLAFPLIPGDNRLDLLALDDDGNVVGNATITVTSTVTWQPPSMTSVEPSSGPEAGGTHVTIRGADFHRGAVVRFAAALATVDSVALTEIHATAPSGSGAVPVSVTNLDGKSAALPAAFTYTLPKFVRGDADGDGAVSISDVLAILQHLFRAGTLDCQSAADTNDDGALDLRDPIRLLFHLFASGGPLPAPGPDVGVDPTPDALPCSRSGP